jgi:hypothetical protein
MTQRPILPAILTLVTIGLALSGPASAKTIYASGDWSLDDSRPGTAGQGTCVAATATYLGNSGVYSFNVVLDKTGAHPLELMIRPFRSPSPVGRFEVTLHSGRAYGFVKLPPTARGEDTFWNIPHGTSQLLSELKAADRLAVVAVNGLGELPFSLNGSAAVLKQLEKRCVMKPSLNYARFEAAFLPDAVDTIDYSQIDQPRAALLRDLVAKGTAAYLLVDEKTVALADVESRHTALVQEQATLPGAIARLANHDVPALRQARAAAQSAIDRAGTDIVAAQAQIAARQKPLASAKAASEEALAKRRPFVAENERLAGILQADRDREAAAESALAGAEQKLKAAKQHDAHDLEPGELTAQRDSAAAALTAARRAATGSAAALATYREKVKYEALEAEVSRAANRMAAVQAEIAQFGDTVADRQRVAREQAALRDDTDQRLAAAAAAIKEKTARIPAVKAALALYPSERQSAAAAITEAQKGLAAASAALAAQLPPPGKR